MKLSISNSEVSVWEPDQNGVNNVEVSEETAVRWLKAVKDYWDIQIEITKTIDETIMRNVERQHGINKPRT